MSLLRSHCRALLLSLPLSLLLAGGLLLLPPAAARAADATAPASPPPASNLAPLLAVQQAELSAADAAGGDVFGSSVAISGDTALVGAPNHTVGGQTYAGAAYLYTRSGTSWSLQQELTDPGAASGDNFGCAVALSGNTALIAAYGKTVAGNLSAGAVYVFTRSGTTWTEQKELTASDAAFGDYFGTSLALSGSTALVGAMGKSVAGQANAGAAYLFTGSGASWTQLKELSASDPAASANFGYSVALCGSTALVGAAGVSVAGQANAGAAYLFTGAGASWTQQKELSDPGAAANDQFGRSVALSGSTALIGAPEKTVAGQTSAGTAYLFTGAGASWTQQTELSDPGATAGDNFAYAVALSGGTALIGAPEKTVAGQDQAGAAYVFTGSGASWTQQSELSAADAASGDQFGNALALSGTTALLGAPEKTLPGKSNAGAAYAELYASTPTISITNPTASSSWTTGSAQQVTWTLSTPLAIGQFHVWLVSADNLHWYLGKVVPTVAGQSSYSLAIAASVPAGPGYKAAVYWQADPAVATYQATAKSAAFMLLAPQAKLSAVDAAEYNYFGSSVAISGDTALVGTPNKTVGNRAYAGAAYLYTRSGTTWSLQAELSDPDVAFGDLFGYSVALSGNTALIGAAGTTVGGQTSAGAVYVFTRSGTTWTEQKELTAADAAGYNYFGSSVALSGNTALISAPEKTVAGQTSAGAAYLFTGSGASWTQQKELTASDAAGGANFGSSVALSGGTALVGAEGVRVAGQAAAGAAYVFTGAGTSWTQQKELSDPGAAANDQFGRSVALSGSTALIGAPEKTVAGQTSAGAAYLFTGSGASWTQQKELSASDSATDDLFGSSVALSGGTALVGAFGKTVGGQSGAGAAYVFMGAGASWTQQSELSAADAAANDQFGTAVALSGTTALVGAPYKTVAGQSYAGAAYAELYASTPTISITSPTASSSWKAGSSQKVTWTLSTPVAIGQFRVWLVSATGGWYLNKVVPTVAGQSSYSLTITASVPAGSYRAAVYWQADPALATYQATAKSAAFMVLAPQAKLSAADGAGGDVFGSSVAICGDTALVGAPDKTVGGHAYAGAAYVYTRSGTTWSLQKELTDPGAAAGDNFGSAVALSGDTALIGAYGTIVAGHASAGAVYVYTRSATTWTEQKELTASDAAADDGFGCSLVFSGSTALVGAMDKTVAGQAEAGAAYLFSGSGASWTQLKELTASDAAAYDGFGKSVALSGTTALVGAPYHTVGGHAYAGAAYLFSGSGTSWAQQKELSDPAAAANDQFGESVALSGTTALVGAMGKTVAGQAGAGAAYVFMGAGASWTQEKELSDPGASSWDDFGISVALSGDTALIGASQETVAGQPVAGAAYVFTGAGTSWNQQGELTAADAASDDWFGGSVALSGNTALIGAPQKKSNTGAAYAELYASTPTISITSPTATSSWKVGSSQKVTWTLSTPVAVGQFHVWLVTADNLHWYLGKVVPAVVGQTSYSLAVTASVPAGSYKAAVYWQAEPALATYQATAKSAAFTVTP